MGARAWVRATVAAALAVAGMMAATVPAHAGGQPLIRVDVVVNGAPTSALEITRTCTDTPGDASVQFTASESPALATAVMSGAIGSTCTVTATVVNGATVSFVCDSAEPDVISCSTSPTSATLTKVGTNGNLGLITVTFDVPAEPPTPSEESAVAAPLVAAPRTTG